MADGLAPHGCEAPQPPLRYAATVLAKPCEPGSACAVFARPGVASLRQFAVDPALQGQGLGERLVQACRQWAQATGHHTLALDTAEPALHLVRWYSHLGFVPAGHVQWPGKVYRSLVMTQTWPAR